MFFRMGTFSLSSATAEEVEGGFELTIPVPGASAEDVEVTAAGRVLTVKQKQKSIWGDSSQSFQIPSSVDCANISASAKHGMLKVFLPIKATEKARTIPVQTV